MTALYVALLLTVAGAVVGMFWLRRAADRSWRLHQQRAQIARNWINFQITITDQLTPALDRMAKAVADMQPKFAALAAALRESQDGHR